MNEYKEFFLFVLILLILSVSAFGQEPQVGIDVLVTPNWDRKPHSTGLGVEGNATLGIGEYVRIVNSVGRTADDYNGGVFHISNLNVNSTGRIYPIEFVGWKPFGSIGINYRRSKIDSGWTESNVHLRQNFASFELGVGLNYEDRVIASYRHVFSDFVSDPSVDHYSYSEHGDKALFEGFVPVGTTKWRVTSKFGWYRNAYKFSPKANSYTFGVGFSRAYGKP